MNTVPVDLDRVKRIVDVLVKGDAIDSIIQTMDHGFGNVEIKVSIQNGTIKVLSVSNTKTVKVDEMK